MARRLSAPGRGAGLRGAAPVPLRIGFVGLNRQILLPPELLEPLRSCLTGWQITPAPQPNAEVLCRIEPERGGLYRIRSVYFETPMEGLPAASAICALLADVSQAWCEAAPRTLGLHCGAAQIGGRLVVLTGLARSGKSTICARLCAEPGVELFCDDVLPLRSDGQATALGIAPRLRLPLPARVDPGFRRFVADHLGLRDDLYGYLSGARRAPHGQQAPIAALVLLDRRDGQAARLHRMAPAEALHRMLVQTITDLDSGAAAFKTGLRLTQGLPAFRMVYSDLEEAVALLLSAFGGAVALPPGLDIGPEIAAPPPEPAGPPVDPTQVFRRAGRVTLRQHGADAFLWRPGAPMLYRLNPVAAAVWTLLELPTSSADLAAALAEYFPDVPGAVLLSDMRHLLGDLAQEGLVARQ